MSEIAPVTVAVPPDLEDALLYLSEQSGQTVAALAEKALRRFVQFEVPMFEQIEEGLDDVAVGRVVPHEEVMRDISRHIRERKSDKAA